MIYSVWCHYSLANMNISVSTVVCMVAAIMSMVVMSVMYMIVYVGHCLLLADYRTFKLSFLTFKPKLAVLSIRCQKNLILCIGTTGMNPVKKAELEWDFRLTCRAEIFYTESETIMCAYCQCRVTCWVNRLRVSVN